jgi:hypothetical protein
VFVEGRDFVVIYLVNRRFRWVALNQVILQGSHWQSLARCSASSVVEAVKHDVSVGDLRAGFLVVVPALSAARELASLMAPLRLASVGACSDRLAFSRRRQLFNHS